jgi:hypothetical protein
VGFPTVLSANASTGSDRCHRVDDGEFALGLTVVVMTKNDESERSDPSDLGGFGHADSIEPGVLDEIARRQDEGERSPLDDPEGLTDANTDESSD